jgi:hypothetical protein
MVAIRFPSSWKPVMNINAKIITTERVENVLYHPLVLLPPSMAGRLQVIKLKASTVIAPKILP